MNEKTVRESQNRFYPIVKITGTDEGNSEKKNATVHPYSGQVHVGRLYRYKRFIKGKKKKKRKGKGRIYEFNVLNLSEIEDTGLFDRNLS